MDNVYGPSLGIECMGMNADPASSRALISDRGRSVSESTCDDGNSFGLRAPLQEPRIIIGCAAVGGGTKRELKLDPDPSGFEQCTDITE